MTTSGLTSSTMLAEEVVQAALQELGVVAAGENPTGEETQMALRSLTWMLKGWQARGANLWRASSSSVVVPANSAALALSPSILDVVNARVVVSTAYQRPLFRYERAQYQQLPNKAARGVPTVYYADRQRDAVTLSVWPVPASDTTLALDTTRVIEDVTDGTQTIDVPQEWIETLYVALAARLAIPFGVARVDSTAASVIAQRAVSLEQLMFDADRPASIYMGAMGGRGF